MIVVDTNVISEMMRDRPSAHVMAWTGAQNDSELHTTAVNMAEIRFGIERMPDGRRKSLLEQLEVDVFGVFHARILPFDNVAAREYALIVSAQERAGMSVDAFDNQIAAICRVHGATLATRNVKHFEDAGVNIVDPWAAT